MSNAANESTDEGARFAIREVARIFDLPESRLRYWSQTGFIVPSSRDGTRLTYSFKDLVAIKVAKGLLDAGLPLQRVRRSIGALKLHLPRVDDPLASLRVRCDLDRVVVGDGDRSFDPTTGQLLLDFDVRVLHEQVATVLALPWVETTADSSAAPSTAYDWFVAGRDHELAWDGDPASPQLEQAIECYSKALELEPSLSGAATNLGSLLAEKGDLDAARDAFDHALSFDPSQPEARFNLAELALRQSDTKLAIVGFRELVKSHPDYLEAHYGLARALLSAGERAAALTHLERFCGELERRGAAQRDAELSERYACALEVAETLRRELQGGD